MNLSWKRPLLYLLIPVFIVMVFLGFPPPLPPANPAKPSQELSAPAHKNVNES